MLFVNFIVLIYIFICFLSINALTYWRSRVSLEKEKERKKEK